MLQGIVPESPAGTRGLSEKVYVFHLRGQVGQPTRCRGLRKQRLRSTAQWADIHVYQQLSKSFQHTNVYTYISIFQRIFHISIYILTYFNCIADVLLNEFINNLISTLSTYINIFIIFQRISPVWSVCISTYLYFNIFQLCQRMSTYFTDFNAYQRCEACVVQHFVFQHISTMSTYINIYQHIYTYFNTVNGVYFNAIIFNHISIEIFQRMWHVFQNDQMYFNVISTYYFNSI